MIHTLVDILLIHKITSVISDTNCPYVIIATVLQKKEKYGKEKHQDICYLEVMGNIGDFFLSFLYFLIFYGEHIY